MRAGPVQDPRGAPRAAGAPRDLPAVELVQVAGRVGVEADDHWHSVRVSEPPFCNRPPVAPICLSRGEEEAPDSAVFHIRDSCRGDVLSSPVSRFGPPQEFPDNEEFTWKHRPHVSPSIPASAPLSACNQTLHLRVGDGRVEPHVFVRTRQEEPPARRKREVGDDLRAQGLEVFDMQRLKEVPIVGELFAGPYVPARRVAHRRVAEPMHGKHPASCILRDPHLHVLVWTQRVRTESRADSGLGRISRYVHENSYPFRVKANLSVKRSSTFFPDPSIGVFRAKLFHGIEDHGHRDDAADDIQHGEHFADGRLDAVVFCFPCHDEGDNSGRDAKQEEPMTPTITEVRLYF